MDEEKRMEFLFELLHRPIPWDPIPPWLKLDEKIQRQFAQMEIRLALKEVEIQQQKIQEFGKMIGI